MKVQLFFWFTINDIFMEAQRYHCKYNFTAVSIILLPHDLFHCREICVNAASFILLPREFILMPQILFSPLRVLFYCPEI